LAETDDLEKGLAKAKRSKAIKKMPTCRKATRVVCVFRRVKAAIRGTVITERRGLAGLREKNQLKIKTRKKRIR